MPTAGYANAKLLYEDTSPERLTNLAGIGEAVRSQMLLSRHARSRGFFIETITRTSAGYQRQLKSILGELGSKIFGWEGVYTHLKPVGSFMPYAESVKGLIEQQFAGYYAWLQATTFKWELPKELL